MRVLKSTPREFPVGHFPVSITQWQHKFHLVMRIFIQQVQGINPSSAYYFTGMSSSKIQVSLHPVHWNSCYSFGQGEQFGKIRHQKQQISSCRNRNQTLLSDLWENNDRSCYHIFLVILGFILSTIKQRELHTTYYTLFLSMFCILEDCLI